MSRTGSRCLLLLLALGSLLAVGCIGALVDSFTGEDVASQIRATGLPAEGKILEIWETGTWVNNSPVVGFLFEVHAEGREPWKAETKALISILGIPRIQPGKFLPLKFDPNDPTRIALVPLH